MNKKTKKTNHRNLLIIFLVIQRTNKQTNTTKNISFLAEASVLIIVAITVMIRPKSTISSKKM